MNPEAHIIGSIIIMIIAIFISAYSIAVIIDHSKEAKQDPPPAEKKEFHFPEHKDWNTDQITTGQRKVYEYLNEN